MKKRIGLISGFIIGVTGFLLMFKLIFLDNNPPSDELAPGIVVIAAIMNGLVFAFVGSAVQIYLVRKRTQKIN